MITLRLVVYMALAGVFVAPACAFAKHVWLDPRSNVNEDTALIFATFVTLGAVAGFCGWILIG